MTKESKFQLPLVLNIPGSASSKGTAKPVLGPYQPITSRDIIHLRPLNRHFQGRVYQWVETESKRHGFSLEEVLPPHNLDIFMRFFYPQSDGKWLTESEAVGHKNSRGFRDLTRESLARIYRRIMHGPEAIEILKPNRVVYLALIHNSKNTLTDVMYCTSEEFIHICGSRNIFDQLVGRIHHHYPDWRPSNFLFPSEEPHPQPVPR